MGRPLRALLIAGDDDRIEAIDRALRDNGIAPQITVVRHLPAAADALAQAEFDVAICEHTPPQIDQAAVLDLVQSSPAEVALLVVSDQVDAMQALDAVHAGVSDWLIDHSLARRLGPAVERAVREREERLEHAETLRRLEDSERHYRELADTLPQIVYEADTEGHLTFINRRGLEVLGIAEDQRHRRVRLSDFLAGENLERGMAHLRRVTAGDDVGLEVIELTAHLPDGRDVPVMVFSSPIVREGEIVGERGVVIDLTEIKQAQQRLAESERRYRTLFNAIGDGLVTVNREGVITYCNQALADMVGLSVDDLQGHMLWHLLSEENAALISEHMGARTPGAAASSCEINVDLQTGEVATLLITATALCDDSGQVVGSLGVVKDITAQRRDQAQLLRIKAGLDNAGDAVGIVDEEGRNTYANPAFERLFGCSGSEFVERGGPLWFATIPEEYERARQSLERTGSFTGEIEMRSCGGRVFPTLTRVDQVLDKQNRIAGYVGVMSDITERREREEQLRLTNARLELMNRIGQRLNAGDPLDDIIAAGVDGLREILELDEAFILLRDPADPDTLLLQHASTAPDHVPPIDEQVLEQLRGTRLRLNADSPVAQVYQARADLELRGLEACAGAVSAMTVPEYPSLPRELAEGVRINQTGYIFTAPLVSGERVIGHLSLSRQGDTPLADDEKAVAHTFAEQLAVAIEKSRTAEELLRANQFLRGVLDNVAIWFAVIDETHQMKVWNRAAEEISGYRADEFDNVDELMEYLFPDQTLRANAYEHALRTMAGDDKAGTFETVIRRKDGSNRTMLWHLRRISEPAPGSTGGLLVVGSDVTERRELQEQLRRSQRMEAVGTLAGGIAHDFNNVLTAVLGHADLLASDAEEDPRVRWHALQIADAAARASGLTRQLLAFSRRQPVRPQIVDLNRIVRGMVQIFRRLIRADIELHFDLSADLGYTRADPVQIEQVIMNLVVNARDAMPEGGRLTISTHNAELSSSDMTELFDAEPGEYVVLSVADTGIGMDAETEAHIFEPFFSTKADRGGTGLGLATVYGIVRQSDGAITVYSEPGEGSIFRVYLPRTDHPGAAEGVDVESDLAMLRGTETVLVVEDTENLRTLVHTMLESLGYTVYSASSGAEALQLAAAHAGEIDLVATDVIMPEMSGTDLAERLIASNPHLRVLYVSGYPTEKAVEAENQDARFSFLQKPFSATELGRKLRELFDSPPLIG